MSEPKEPTKAYPSEVYLKHCDIIDLIEAIETAGDAIRAVAMTAVEDGIDPTVALRQATALGVLVALAARALAATECWGSGDLGKALK